jgi:glycosyltransferase involved in cell wall biosynthesis
MKLPPKISIVIPSYNKAGYIGETLESIVTQNYPNLEVIIQDGGSTDGSVNIIKKYASKYNYIKWVSKKDKGQVDAINTGLNKATGDILTYINADDVYEKGAFKTVGEYFAENPNTLWLAGRGRVIDKNGKEISKWVTAYKNLLLTINNYKLLLIVNYLMQPSVFLSKETYKKFGPFKGGKFVMEYDLWLKIGREKMPQIFYKFFSKFRLAGDNISSLQYNKQLKMDEKIVNKYTSSKLILLLHNIHNLVRTIIVKAI